MFVTANIRAVRPSGSLSFASAPLSSNAFTVSVCPSSAARNSSVCPPSYLVALLVSARVVNAPLAPKSFRFKTVHCFAPWLRRLLLRGKLFQ